MLKDLLKQENILVRVRAGDWESAVWIGGVILMQNGYVEAEFVDAVVQMIKERGPCVVISPGVAFCSVSSECSVKKAGMSLITLNKPICFGNQYNDPVKTVICLATIDDASYRKTLELVVKKIHDGSIDAIGNAKKIDEIIKILQ